MKHFAVRFPRIPILLRSVILLIVLHAVLQSLEAATPSSVALASVPNPTVLGGAVRLTAIVTPGNATGAITFYDGITILGRGSIANGAASLGTIQLETGIRLLRAFYSGDSTYAPSISQPLPQMVNAVSAGAFAASVPYADGTDAAAIATGDFNGDGKIDLVTANSGAGVNVLLGNGDGTLGEAVTYDAGFGPYSVAVGDFNGDGFQDLAVADLVGTVSVLLGNGDGTFQPSVPYKPASYNVDSMALAVRVADFNLDGKADLIIANNGPNTVDVLLGNGDGTFTAGGSFPAGFNLWSVAVSDFNGDGKADVAAISNAAGNNVTVLLGKGDGTFQRMPAITAGSSLLSVVAADFNGDGKTDLAITGDSSVNVLAGNGDGTFQPVVSYSVDITVRSVTAGDLTGDGNTDLALAGANQSGGFTSVLVGNGDGTFQPAVDYPTGEHAVAVATADFSGDGRADLAVAETNGQGVFILLGGIALPDLTIATTHTGNFAPGQAGAVYTITASNAGAAMTTGTVTVTDTVPAGLTATDIGGTGWSCILATLTCTRSDVLAGESAYPTIALTVNVDINAPAAVTNTVTVSGGGESNLANDKGTDPTTIQAPPLTITASALPSPTVGTSYSAVLTATGGVSPYSSWRVSAGSLPPGLALNAGTGLIGGTPTSAAGSPFTFKVTVTDRAGNTSLAQTFAMTVIRQLTVSPDALAGGEAGVAYSTTVAASGGTPPYGNWTVSAGSLPPGLSLNPNTGTIGGTPTTETGSPFALSVTVKDAVGATSAAQALSIAIAPHVTVSAAALSAGEVNAAYSVGVTAAGGIQPYSNWTVSAGSLPAGVTLNAATGVIGGTPSNAAGRPFGFSITVKDAAGGISAAQALSIAIAPQVAVTATSLPAGVVGAAYSATLTATGGTAPYSNWTVSAGSLPAGLTLNAGTGAIGGTPTSAAGSPFSFSVTVKDGPGNTSAGQAFSLVIAPAVMVTAATLPAGEVNASYSTALAATGGVPPYSNWAVSAGILPPGLMLNAGTGAISGTPTTTAGSPFAFSVTANDSAGHTSAGQAFSITVNTAVSVTAAALPGGAVGAVYSVALAASGGSAPYSNWTVSAGLLPAGLTLNPATGVIGGTPASAAGSPFGFGVTVRDNAGSTSAAQAFSITVAPVVSVTALSLPVGEVSAIYSAALSATGGIPPYGNWTVSAGSLPPGLTLNAGTGAISGTPTSAAGSPFGFSVTAKDSAGDASAARAFSIAISTVLTVTTTSVPGGAAGSVYSTTLAASGGTPAYGAWIVSAGGLPPGLTLNAGTGVIAGTPGTAAGSPFNFSVTVKDAASATSAAQALSIAVSPQVTVATGALGGGEVGAVYSATLAASNGIPPYNTWTVSAGSLPPGLTLNPANGSLSGTPTNAAGSPFGFSVTVKDAGGAMSLPQALSIAIASQVVVTAASPGSGEVGAAYSATLVASGGIAPYNNWTVSGGSLAQGLTLNGGTGAIGGTPTTAVGSPFSFTVTVKDAAGVTSHGQAFSIVIATGVVVTSATLPTGEVNATYSAALLATGGVPPYSNWTVSAGSLPSGLTLDAAGGVVTGTPTSAAGSPFGFSVTAKDSAGTISAAQAFSIPVNSAVTVSPATLAGGVVGVVYTATLTSSGGSGPYSNWTVSGATLPPGLTLNAGTGAISGTPTSATGSPFAFGVSVKDAAGNTSATQTFSIGVAGPVTVTTTSVPAGTIGTAYSKTLAATGGVPPYGNWAVSAGSLPPGLSLNAASGVIAGTPAGTAGSPFGFSVTVQDSAGHPSAAQALSMVLAQPVTVNFALLPVATVGIAYSAGLTASGGVPSYSTWVVVDGELPPGLLLDPDTGVISGAPVSVDGGTFPFKVTVSDSTGHPSAAQSLWITVAPKLSVTTKSLPDGVMGTAYSTNLAAAGGTLPYTKWTVAGSLPPGLSLNASTGVIGGVPTTTTGSPFAFAVSATDSTGAASEFRLLSIKIVPAIFVPPANLPGGVAGKNYSATLSASGGTPPYGPWTLVTGSLPPGLNLDTSAGTISGLPITSTGSPLKFEVSVKDQRGVAAPSQLFSITIAANAAAPVITPGGIGPVYSSSNTIQAGSWISIYGKNLANTTAIWNGDFPTSLGGVSVTIDDKAAYLWYVSPTQINLQAPDDAQTGQVTVVVKNAGGSMTSTVTLARAGPSLSLLGDGKHVAGVIPTPDGSGAYGSGGYDLVGPDGAFAFNTRPVKQGEVLVLYGVGFGATNPSTAAGQAFSGAAPTMNPVTFTIGGIAAEVTFSGITEAGLYQFNLTVPKTGSGDMTVLATVSGLSTPTGPVVTVQ